MKNKLNFFCVGAQKAGTTSLFHILKQHPDIFIPELKEAPFFSDEKRYSHGYDMYWRAFFSDYADQKRVGTITPEYMLYPLVPQRIKEKLGLDTKFIFLLRDPIQRAFSHYRMSRRRGLESLNFKEAIETEKERITFNGGAMCGPYSYLTRGKYSSQINGFLKHFPKENCLFVLFQEDFNENRDETVGKIIDFLELPQLEIEVDIRENQAGRARLKFLNWMVFSKSPMMAVFKKLIPHPGLRRWLGQFIEKVNTKSIDDTEKEKLSPEFKKSIYDSHFKDEIDTLEKLIARDLSHWKH